MKLDTMKKGYAQLNAGVWVGNIPQPMFDGVRLKVRRLWNPDYRDLYAKLEDEHSDLSAEANAARITTACLVQACLVDWEGIDEPFTADLAAALIADPDAGPSFRTALLWCAQQAGEQVKAQLEADAKNSPTP